MIRGKINTATANKILNVLKTIQNPELNLFLNKSNPFMNIIDDPTHSIGVIKIDNIAYSKYDAWIRRQNYLFLK